MARNTALVRVKRKYKNLMKSPRTRQITTATVFVGVGFLAVWLLRRGPSMGRALGRAVMAERGLVTEPIYFDYGSSAITSESRRRLDRVAGAATTERFRIIGHTDNIGGDSFNYRLGLDRAQSVADYLVDQGLGRGSIIEVKSQGVRDPIVSNDTEEGRALNRRVEVQLV